jgi:hypothetical protein
MFGQEPFDRGRKSMRRFVGSAIIVGLLGVAVAVSGIGGQREVASAKGWPRSPRSSSGSSPASRATRSSGAPPRPR